MVNTRQFSGSTYMQDMTKSHTFSAKNQGSTYTPIRLIRREIRYLLLPCFRRPCAYELVLAFFCAKHPHISQQQS